MFVILLNSNTVNIKCFKAHRNCSCLYLYFLASYRELLVILHRPSLEKQFDVSHFASELTLP